MSHTLQYIKLLSLAIFAMLSVNCWATTYYVSPNGSDSNDGNVNTAFASIQLALDKAQSGDKVMLASGNYFQDVHSVMDGTISQPIQIEGPRDAIIRGAGNDRVFYITHDYIHLSGFTINGLHGDRDSPEGYRDKLLYIHGRDPHDGPTGIKITRMTLENAGGECLRFRYFVQKSEVAYSTFNHCGVHDFQFKGKCKDCKGKNGEAIYIGSSSKQWNDAKKNPTNDPDQSSDNWIHHNIMNTSGSE